MQPRGNGERVGLAARVEAGGRAQREPLAAIRLVSFVARGDCRIEVTVVGAQSRPMLVFLDTGDVDEERDGRDVFEMQRRGVAVTRTPAAILIRRDPGRKVQPIREPLNGLEGGRRCRRRGRRHLVTIREVGNRTSAEAVPYRPILDQIRLAFP